MLKALPDKDPDPSTQPVPNKREVLPLKSDAKTLNIIVTKAVTTPLTTTLQEPVPSQFSNDEMLPDAWTMAKKNFCHKRSQFYTKETKI